MDDTTQTVSARGLPRIGRHYDPVRTLAENRREQLVLAKDRDRQDEVVLRRVVLPQPQDSFIFQERASRLLFLKHQNLAGVRDYFVDPDGRGVLVMERHQGMTLEEYAGEIQPMLQPRRIVHEIAAVALGVARGLDAMHRQSLVHGAVTPMSIVMSGRDGFPVLGNYALGIAPAASPAQTDHLCTSWIAPEVKSLHKVPLDPRADLYSLGATVYSLLVGVAPRAKDDEFTPASKFNIHVDAVLDAVLADLVRRDPDQRLGSAAEAVQRFEAWKAANGPSAEPTGTSSSPA